MRSWPATPRERRRFLGIGGFTEYLKTCEKGLYLLPETVDTATAAVVEPDATAQPKEA